jgi:hypothetical protein
MLSYTSPLLVRILLSSLDREVNLNVMAKKTEIPDRYVIYKDGPQVLNVPGNTFYRHLIKAVYPFITSMVKL